jgi:predicted metal-dependent phosphoesterase TrpH
VDLHVHSTASDGRLSPAAVVERAAAAGLGAVGLTDHDTLAGVAEAIAAGGRLGIRVVPGCEFSAAAPWGEMHVLGYFLPAESPELEAFLARCRADRVRRGREMVERLNRLGVDLRFEDVLRQAGGGAVGRPHVARAIVSQGGAAHVGEAFDRYIGRGRPAFVEKVLPSFSEVAAVVHGARGLVSIAHLKDRGTRSFIERLKSEGLDAVETRHPSHDGEVRSRLTDIALRLGLLRSGGSDWHGDPEPGTTHGALGSQEVPLEWLERLEQFRAGSAAAAVS